MEARPYALSAAATVWLSVLLITAADRNRPSTWVLFGIGTALSILLNLCTALMLLVHAAMLRYSPAPRNVVIRWAATSLVALAAVSPFLVFARGQLWQVSWISPLKSGTIHDILVDQYFPHSNIFAIVAGVIIGVAVVVMVVGKLEGHNGGRSLVMIALAWLVLPTAAFLLYSAVVDPMYFPRYLYFTAPAMALVLGVSVVAVGRTPVAMAALLTALAAAATPNYLSVQRGPYAKEGMDYSQVADLLTQHATTGDCLVMDNTIRWKPGPIRAMTEARPAAFRKLVDPGRGPSGASLGRLWDGHLAVWSMTVAGRLARCDVLWIVSEHDNTRPGHESGANLPAGPAFGDAPASRITHFLGFRLVERWQFNFAQVMKATR
jgi:mannosyltransferase